VLHLHRRDPRAVRVDHPLHARHQGDVGRDLRLKEEGQFGAIAVLGLVMLAMTFATVALVQRVLGRDFLGARE
jgi:hypothetical protein